MTTAITYSKLTVPADIADRVLAGIRTGVIPTEGATAMNVWAAIGRGEYVYAVLRELSRGLTGLRGPNLGREGNRLRCEAKCRGEEPTVTEHNGVNILQTSTLILVCFREENGIFADTIESAKRIIDDRGYHEELA